MAAFEIEYLHHVNISVTDLEAARTFYCDGLRLSEIDRPDFATPGFWLQAGPVQIHVALRDDPPPPRNHFALRVDDLDAAIAHLEALGIAVRPFPTVAGAGRQIGLSDPSGNRIELNQLEAI